MKIGVPKEIKKDENRVALTPGAARELVGAGAQVFLEQGAGIGSGFTDQAYTTAGVRVVERAQVFDQADLILKVKEPQAEEFHEFRPGCSLFTFLHLAAGPKVTAFLKEKNITALAYESLRDRGILPLLLPMSEIAGRMAPLVGSYYLQSHMGGSGVLPAGATGTSQAKALVIGAGVVGSSAARIAWGLGMDTLVMNITDGKLQRIDELFHGHVKTRVLTEADLEEEIAKSDLVVGAVLVPDARTPVIVNRSQLKTMRPGSVVVDVSIDQGGLFETSRPTTHGNPVYVEEGIQHYCVANMPGAFPRTATLALTSATLPYIKELVKQGLEAALETSAALASAVNVRAGQVLIDGLE